MVTWRNFLLRRYLTYTCFRFFVTPSDSVAIIAANAVGAIPYFSSGLKGVARYNSDALNFSCLCASVFFPRICCCVWFRPGSILAMLMVYLSKTLC